MMGVGHDTEASARRVVERLRQFFARAGMRRRRTDPDPKLRRYELFEQWCIENHLPTLPSAVPVETTLGAAATVDREAWHALLMTLNVADALRRAEHIADVSERNSSSPTAAVVIYRAVEALGRIVIPVDGDVHDFETGLCEGDTQIASLAERYGIPPEPEGKRGTRPYKRRRTWLRSAWLCSMPKLPASGHA